MKNLEELISQDIRHIQQYAEIFKMPYETANKVYSLLLTKVFEDYSKIHNKEVNHLIKDKGITAYAYTVSLMGNYVQQIMEDSIKKHSDNYDN